MMLDNDKITMKQFIIVKVKTAQDELHTCKKQLEWYEEELQTKTKQHALYSTQVLEENNQLKSDFEIARTDLIQCKSTQKSIEKEFNDLKQAFEKKEANLNEKIKEVERTLELNKSDLDAERKLKELWNQTANDFELRINDLNEEKANMQAKFDEHKQEFENEKAKFVQKEAQLIEKVNELCQKVNSSKHSDNPDIQNNADHNENSNQATSSSSQLFTEEISFTQLYSKYAQLQTKTHQQEYEITRLNLYINQVLKEIDQKAPILEQQKRDYESINEKNNCLTEKIASLEEEKEELFTKVQQYGQEQSQCNDRKHQLETEITTLSKQVQTLLYEKQPLQTPDSNDNQVQDYDCRKIITEKLTGFKNIEELQIQNQKLLRITHELSTKLESYEEQYSRLPTQPHQSTSQPSDNSNFCNQQLDNIQLNALKKECEMLHKIIQSKHNDDRNHDNDDDQIVNNDKNHTTLTQEEYQEYLNYPKKLSRLQSEFDTYRTEAEINREMLNKRNSSLLSDYNEIKTKSIHNEVNLNSLQAQKDEFLQKIEYQRKEIKQYIHRNQLLDEGLTRFENRIVALNKNLNSITLELAQSKNDNSSLSRESNLLKLNHENLLKENEQLNAKQKYFNVIIENMQVIQHDSVERNLSESVRKTDWINKLETENAQFKTRIEKAERDYKILVSQREEESKSNQEKHTTIESKYQIMQQEITTMETTIKECKQQINELESKNSKLQEKLDEALQSNPDEAQRQAKLDDLTLEVENAKKMLSSAKESELQYKSISEISESKLKELNSTFERFKSSTQAQLTEKQNQITRLYQQAEELQDTSNQYLEENVQLHEDIRKLQDEFDGIKSELDRKSNQLNGFESERSNQEKEYQNTISELKISLNEAENKFHHQVILHAQQTQSVQSLTKELDSAKTRLQDNEKQIQELQTLVGLKEGLLTEQNQKFEKNLMDITNRCQDVEHQNNILLKQLEGTLKAAENISTDQTISELNQVIQFLRREKDIVNVQYELSNSYSARLKLQIDELNNELKDAHNLLKQQETEEKDSKQQIEQGQVINKNTMSTSTQHQEIMNQIQQLNVLKESNEILRNENASLSSEIVHLNSELSSINEKYSSIQEKYESIEVELESKVRNINSLETDNKQWKERMQKILERHDVRVDPVEHNKLKDQISNYEEEIKGLKERITKLQTLEANNSAKITLLKNHCANWKKKCEQLNTQMEDKSQSVEQLQKDKTQLSSSNDVMKKQFEIKNKELDQIRSQIAQLQETEAKRKELIRSQSAKLQETEAKLKECETKHTEYTSKVEADKAEEEAKFVKMKNQALTYYRRVSALQSKLAEANRINLQRQQKQTQEPSQDQEEGPEEKEEQEIPSNLAKRNQPTQDTESSSNEPVKKKPTPERSLSEPNVNESLEVSNDSLPESPLPKTDDNN